MSEENVEIVLGIARASSEGDVDYVIRHTTEDFVMFVARSSVEGPYVGHDGIRQWFADNRENFDHRSTSIRSLSFDAKPARSHACLNRVNRSDTRPSSSPKISCSRAVCLITPGSLITAAT